ncbi:MAG: hypothetical protein HYZ28_19635 [Myxococcales bacterium]|nr:hypothetical protein [Myxococcales bacterium]
MATKKLAISLPEELFDQVERARLERELTRSAVIQTSLRAWLKDEAAAKRLRRHLDAYRRKPETDAEVAEASAISRASWSASLGRQRRKRPRR